MRLETLGREAFGSTEFQLQWQHRCLNENAIAPDVYKANIRFVEGQAIYEDLGWDIPKQRGFRLQSFNEAVEGVNENGEVWQVKLDVPRVSKDGKSPKYESPKGKGAQIYKPSVPARIRKLMSTKFGVDVPLMGSFWDWQQTSDEAKELPVLMTEGLTKTLAALSAGFPCISLYGCSSAWQKRENRYEKKVLMPQLRGAVRGRCVYFCFDQDTKPETIQKVHSSIKAIGKSVAVLASEVKVLEWDKRYKGLDDSIAGQGLEVFEQNFSNALDFKTWKSVAFKNWARSTVEQLGRKATPDIVRNSRWVADCGFPVPKLGEALLSNSPMGSGKTISYAALVKELQKRHDGLVVDAIGHRNNLLLQTADRLNRIVPGLEMQHMRNMGAGRYTQSQINATDGLAYCVDSLWRRFDKLIRAIDDGQKILLILDEVDALLKHLLLSSTLRPTRRIETITKFGILLERIADGGGYVVGGEANLTALAVETLKALSGGKLNVIVGENTVKPEPWEVRFCDGLNSRDKKTTAKQAATQFLEKLLAKGKRVLLLTTSQEAAKQIDVYASNHLGIKVLRIDGENSSEPWAKDLFQDASLFLSGHPARLVIGSPAIESGLSIDKKGLFDAVVLLASGLEPSTSFQMLGRLRDSSVPRYILAEESDSSPSKFDPEAILDQYRTESVFTLKEHGLTTEKQPVIIAAHRLAAKYLARESAGKALLEESLRDRLASDGHRINPERLIIQVDDEMGDSLKAAKTQIQSEFVDRWLELDDSKTKPIEARAILASGCASYEERLLATKTLSREKHDSKVDDRDFVDHFYADKWKGREAFASLRSAAQWENPGMAADSDRRHLSSQIDSTGTIWGIGYRSNQRAFETLQKLNLHHLLSLPEGEALTRDHWATKTVLKSAVAIADEVKETLGLTASDQTNPMSFVIDLFKKFLGFEFESKKVRIPKPIQAEALEYLSHENHIDDPICDFGDSNNQTQTSPQQKQGRGRPKKPPTTQEKRYTLKPCPWREEVIADFVAAHNAYVEAEAEPEAEPEAEATDLDDRWLAPESLTDIRVLWLACASEPERDVIRAAIPDHILKKAIHYEEAA
jgi:hypothetical protein